MPITLTSEISTQPVAAKSFDAVWIKSLNVQANQPTDKVRCNILVAPWNSSTGEIHDAGAKMIIINDVMAECATNEALAKTMGAIFGAVQALIVEKNTFGQ